MTSTESESLQLDIFLNGKKKKKNLSIRIDHDFKVIQQMYRKHYVMVPLLQAHISYTITLKHTWLLHLMWDLAYGCRCVQIFASLQSNCFSDQNLSGSQVLVSIQYLVSKLFSKRVNTLKVFFAQNAILLISRSVITLICVSFYKVFEGHGQ